MKKLLSTAPLFLVFAMTSIALAADIKVTFPIESALSNPKVTSQLNHNIKLYWGDQVHAAIKTNLGEFKTSKRTNAFGKSQHEACQWALASALVTLQERAVKEGGNAIINIKSNINNYEFSDEQEYQCMAGRMMVNVALKGTVVKLEE